MSHERTTVTISTVALWNRVDHYIFILWFLSIFSFPRLISAVAHWLSVILPQMVWRYRLQWFNHLQAQGLGEDEYPAYTLL